LLFIKGKLFPWVILAPKRQGISEIDHLPAEETITEIVEDLFNPKNLIIVTIGYIVPHLHIDVIRQNENEPP